MDSDRSVLVPPRRLGTLLRRARTVAGVELAELAAGSGLTVGDLDDLEHGRRVIDDELLSRLVKLYGVEDAGLLPARSRLVIDLHEGRIAIEHADVPVGTTAGADGVLARYLALVYHLRDLPLGTPLPLRELDVDVLSTALALDAADVERRLRQLMADETRIETDRHRIRRRVLLPLVGIVIAATGVGTLLLVGDEPAPQPAPAETRLDVGTARIADPVVVDAPAAESSTSDGTVVQPPAASADIADPSVVERSEEP